MNAFCSCIKSVHHSRWSFLLAIIIGGISTLSFAPFHLWWVQILTMGWLLALSLSTPLKKILFLALCYGIGHSLFGLSWLYISMHTYGEMNGALAAGALFLFSIVLGLFTLFAVGSAAWFRKITQTPLIFYCLGIFPAVWVLADWLQGWVLTGFPWIVAGYAHSTSPFNGLAPIFGVYGLSWFSALLAGIFVALCITPKPTKIRLGICTIIFLGVTFSTRFIHWTTPQGNPISVRLLQGNIAQETKFSRESIIAAMMRYQRMVEEKPADLIVLPETAIPIFPFQLPQDYIASLDNFARKTQSHLAIGMPYETPQGEFSNSLFVVDPDNPASLSSYQQLYRYDKHHLVPFGEFIPWGFKWFVDKMNIPLGDMAKGTSIQTPFSVSDQWIQPNICYEDLFGEEIAAQLLAQSKANKSPASILLNISNIAWFGHSHALPQHLQISQMRALETGRPMIRSTNTGTTAVIDPYGHVVQQLPTYTIDALSAQVQGYQGLTPYVRWGNSAIIIWAFIVLGSIFFYCRFIFNKRS